MGDGVLLETRFVLSAAIGMSCEGVGAVSVAGLVHANPRIAKHVMARGSANFDTDDCRNNEKLLVGAGEIREDLISNWSNSVSVLRVV